MTPDRERVLVGLFVVVAAAILSVTTLAVWGGMGRSQISHRLYLKFSGGVQPGTPVRYGGLRIGTVRGVRIDPDDSTRIEINFAVDRDAPIKTDSVARLSSLGLLSDYYIEISTGTPQAARAVPDSVLRSTETTGLASIGDTIDSLVPQIHAALDKLTLNLEGLQTTISSANDLLNGSNRANIRQALARANDLLSDSATLERLRSLKRSFARASACPMFARLPSLRMSFTCAIVVCSPSRLSVNLSRAEWI